MKYKGDFGGGFNCINSKLYNPYSLKNLSVISFLFPIPKIPFIFDKLV